MPWQKGIGSRIYKNVGRKGYDVEKEQLDKMSGAVDLDLVLLAKIQNGTATKKEIAAFQVVKERITKYLDKLHATRTNTNVDVTTDGESLNIPFDPARSALAKKLVVEIKKEKGL